uniref:Translocator protein n=1 Tax=Eptatretus burgeri TaxID=7764 RepID=A0A8C4NHJ0_EPTBU
MSKWIPPVCATLLPHIGALQTYAFRHEFKNWYDDLNKPTWCPPKWVFKSAWPIIYTCMGVGSYLIWKELGGFTNEAVVPLGLYATQLALNWSWTPIFFWAHKMGWVSVTARSLVRSPVARGGLEARGGVRVANNLGRRRGVRVALSFLVEGQQRHIRRLDGPMINPRDSKNPLVTAT